MAQKVFEKIFLTHFLNIFAMTLGLQKGSHGYPVLEPVWLSPPCRRAEGTVEGTRGRTVKTGTHGRWQGRKHGIEKLYKNHNNNNNNRYNDGRSHSRIRSPRGPTAAEDHD